MLQANFEVARLTDKVGRKLDALTMHRKVLAGRKALTITTATDVASRVDIARSLIAVGELLEATGKTGEAMTSYEQAREAVMGPAAALRQKRRPGPRWRPASSGSAHS